MYVEPNCTIEHNGKTFESGGAFVSPEYAKGYPDDSGNLRDWHGNVLGSCRVISRRPAIFFGRRSWMGDTWYTYRAWINGRPYSLRGFGSGMIARGKALKC